ncbi:MAG TPA: type III polyketide synthase [Bacteroidota bacterium]|nr:type III polyketide synthase [Bacteroidota bacterium]
MDTKRPGILPGILAIGSANPPNRYPQEQIYNLAAKYSAFYQNARIRQIFLNSDIDFRHLYLDAESFASLETVDQLHERYKRGAVEIGVEAIEKCLSAGGVTPASVDCIIAVSCTGYLCPGLAELYIRELGLRNDVQRADLLGMGCAGAMPGLQRAFDFVRSYPDRKALVVAIEICSACYYLDDSLETVVGNAICGDGAAAVLVGMTDSSATPKISRFDTHLEPSMIETVGFEQRQGMLRIILSKDIRDLAGGLAGALINRMLDRAQLSKDQINHWILHSGGRKVIDNIQSELGLTDDQVRHSKHVLRNFGNMSSPTVLFVLEQVMHETGAGLRATPGDKGIMLALGPGLAVEGALLEW